MRPRMRNKHSISACPTSNTCEPSIDRWRVPGFEAVELHRGSDITQSHPRHWHEELYLCATLRGASYLLSRGTSLLIPRGTLAMVAPGEIHANRKIHCTLRCLFLEFNGLRGVIEQFLERNIPALTFSSGLIEDQLVATKFLKVHRALEEDDAESAKADFVSFLSDLAAHHSSPNILLPRTGNEASAVRQTKEFLDAHYAERVSLHQLARLTGLSAYHLHRSFCRSLGMPPHEYQLQMRITKAKSLLRLGCSISETASLVGFVDQSHFTRHFKRSVRVTPGRFLRQSKNVQDG